MSTAIFLPRTALEPPKGSVVMLEGPAGTAYQRMYSTGLWHSVVTGISVGLRWEELLRRTERAGAFPIILIFDAETAKVAIPVATPEPSSPRPLPRQLAEIDLLAGRIEREVTMPATRADAASLLLTLRARCTDLGLPRPTRAEIAAEIPAAEALPAASG